MNHAIIIAAANKLQNPTQSTLVDINIANLRRINALYALGKMTKPAWTHAMNIEMAKLQRNVIGF